MKKKVIIVSTALWIGGIETALVNLLNQFSYDKYDVTLLLIKAELNMLDQIHPSCKVVISDRDRQYSFDNSYKYRRLYHMTEDTDNPSKLHKMMMGLVPVIRWGENRLYIRYIRDNMKAEHYDTAIIFSDVVAEIAIRSISADKYMMFYHHGSMRHVYHDEIAYRQCKQIVAVSNHLAKELKTFVPEAAGKVVVIHNLMDVDGIYRKSLSKPEEAFNKEKYNIVTVGRVSKEKGMDLAVSACAELVCSGMTNIQWWIIGDGPAMASVKEYIAEMKMEDYFVLVGMKQNPYPYIRHADLYVQPSRVESFGLTIMEALILGKKVVATKTHGGREILSDNKQGILCDLNSHAIAEAIREGMLTPLDNSCMAENCKKKNKNLIAQLENLL